MKERRRQTAQRAEAAKQSTSTPSNRNKRQLPIMSNTGSGGSRGKKKRKKDTPTTRLQLQKEESAVKRAPHLKDSALTNVVGVYSIGHRLNRNLDHWPVEQEGRGSFCCMHRWAADIATKNSTFKCSACGVALCIKCFKVFHTEPDLLAKKQELKELYCKETTTKKTPPNKNK